MANIRIESEPIQTFGVCKEPRIILFLTYSFESYTKLCCVVVPVTFNCATYRYNYVRENTT